MNSVLCNPQIQNMCIWLLILYGLIKTVRICSLSSLISMCSVVFACVCYVCNVNP